jgi:hypothetical protein
MNVKVVVVKPGAKGRPPVCPWLIDAPGAPAPGGPAK